MSIVQSSKRDSKVETEMKTPTARADAGGADKQFSIATEQAYEERRESTQTLTADDDADQSSTEQQREPVDKSPPTLAELSLQLQGLQRRFEMQTNHAPYQMALSMMEKNNKLERKVEALERDMNCLKEELSDVKNDLGDLEYSLSRSDEVLHEVRHNASAAIGLVVAPKLVPVIFKSLYKLLPNTGHIADENPPDKIREHVRLYRRLGFSSENQMREFADMVCHLLYSLS